MLKLAQRVSPVALKAVVGTKADLMEERKVESQKVVVRQSLSLSLSLSLLWRLILFHVQYIQSLIKEFCCEHSEGTQTIPYYETALVPSDSIFVAFQEIIARPLINDYVVSLCVCLLVCRHSVV